MERLQELLSFTFFETEHFKLTALDLVDVVIILVAARLITFAIYKVLKRRVDKNHLEQGKAYAIVQIAKYFVYIIAIILALDGIGVKITVLLAGSTALLVGLGLGLQDAFKDLVAGIVLLTERSITASDIVEVDGIVGQVQEIGLRTTQVRTRDDIEMLIPNQRLINNHIINWSRSNKKTRFAVEVGVAYGSDTKLVEKVLKEVASKHPSILKSPEPYVFFNNFGSSSLEFKLLFFSNLLFRIERVKSELRFEIDAAFREHGITIAFPQMDIWFKNPQDLNKT